MQVTAHGGCMDTVRKFTLKRWLGETPPPPKIKPASVVCLLNGVPTKPHPSQLTIFHSDMLLW